MLERVQGEKQNLMDTYKNSVDEIKNGLMDQIEQLGITLEDYLATGQILHRKIETQDTQIVTLNAKISELEHEISNLNAEISYQITMRDENRLKMEQARMVLDEQLTMHHHFKKELTRSINDYKALKESLNIKNRAYDNLMLEKNKVKTNVNRFKNILKKTESELRANKIKMIDLKQEINVLNEESKLATKESKF